MAIDWESPRRTGIDANDGEINCMIFLLALYLARTAPNEDIGIPERNKRLLRHPPAVANQSAVAYSNSLRIRSPALRKVVSLESCNPFPIPCQIPSWEVPFAMGKSFLTPSWRNGFSEIPLRVAHQSNRNVVKLPELGHNWSS
jgi:hypothetical protein